MKVALGTFACIGIEDQLGSDIPAGVGAALADYARRLESGSAVAMPPFALDAAPGAVTAFDLPVDERTWATLKREAARQGTTVSRLAAHSVLVYLAELDRLTPPGPSA